MDCETDGVVPDRLCGSCPGIVSNSITVQRLIAADPYKLRNRRKVPTVKEIFFHSPGLEIIMSSVASGCHLCSIVSWDENKYFRHKDQSTPASALEQPRVSFKYRDRGMGDRADDNELRYPDGRADIRKPNGKR